MRENDFCEKQSILMRWTCSDGGNAEMLGGCR